MRKNISPNEWGHCLTQLRDARALILRNAESFHESATALEQIGQVISGKIRNGLAAYQPELLELTVSTGKHDMAETARLFHVVREARNSAVHDGAWARHLSSRLVDLLIILEEAIMTKMTRVEDIMVHNPVVAEDWQMVAHIRRLMLANSFSHLPILRNKQWHIVSDVKIMHFIRGAANAKEQKERLSEPIGCVIENGKIETSPATHCHPDETIDLLLAKMVDLPVLVTQDTNGAPRLLGIVTPFDLL